MSNEPGEDLVSTLVEAGFERHAAEVAILSTDGNLNHAASLILGWGDNPPPAIETVSSPASTLRIRPEAAIAQTAESESLRLAQVVPPVPVSSRHAAEAEARERVNSMQREKVLKQARQMRKEAKRRREQELAIWQEQREDAKLRKGGKHKKGDSGAEDIRGVGTGAREATASASTKKVDIQIRLPDGSAVHHSTAHESSLRDVVDWLSTESTRASKLGGREVELRSPFPLPGHVFRGNDLDSTTVEGAGLAPRGRLMVQFCGSSGITEGKGKMPSYNTQGSRRMEGRLKSDNGISSRDPSFPLSGERLLSSSAPTLPLGIREGEGEIEEEEEDVEESNENGSGGEGGESGLGSIFVLGSSPAGHSGVGAGGSSDDGDSDEDDIFDNEQNDGDGAANGDIFEGIAGSGHMLGGTHGRVTQDGLGELGLEGEGRSDVDAMRQVRLARLRLDEDRDCNSSRSRGTGIGGGASLERKEGAAVGTLQEILIDNICRWLVAGKTVGISFGRLDGMTGQVILQRMADSRNLTPAMMSAFRGCPVAALALDRNPWTTNTLLDECGRKVSLRRLTVTHCHSLTTEAMESIAGLQSLSYLNITGCKVTNAWLKAIAKLPGLETLVMRLCTKVGDLGLLHLSRGSPSLTTLDLSDCTSLTDAGIAHLSRMGPVPDMISTGAESQTEGRKQGLVSSLDSIQQSGHRGLLNLTLGRLPYLTNDGLEVLCPGIFGLKELSLFGCASVTNEGLVHIASNLMALVKLCLEGTSVTEAGLVQLRPLFGRLKCVVLPGHGRGLTLLGLAEISGMNSLRELNLEGCRGPGITGDAFSGLSRLTKLRSLSLELADGVDDEILATISSSCTDLEVLNLNGTSVENPRSLVDLAKLMDLGLAHTGVGDDLMEALVELPSLTSLTLRGTKVGSMGVASLSGLSRLRSLNLCGTPASKQDKATAMAIEALQRGTSALSLRI